MTESASTPPESTPVPPRPGFAPREAIAHFQDYAAAEAAVDLLSDKGFDVSSVRIVGHNLRSVENVTGRMNYGKAALYGAGSGAWIGLLLGLILAIFVPLVGMLSTVLWTVVLGAVWGLIFGLIGFAISGGRRSFRSVGGLKAESYTVEVDQPHAAEAMRVLAQGR
ncbi:hypothetical protein GCM10022261_18380 [Brevibacterium daeguense]|uniref:General stress protein 17M-like domain-containing protein n=1 Tax=Brevibacterium daeguense TaxID=909936 RepID=A0ABP8EK34_9MICO|nr:general stress protein [Brevibacterium daeguense]